VRFDSIGGPQLYGSVSRQDLLCHRLAWGERLRDKLSPTAVDSKLNTNAPNSTRIGVRFDYCNPAMMRICRQELVCHQLAWGERLRDKLSATTVDSRLIINAPNSTHIGVRFDYCHPTVVGRTWYVIGWRGERLRAKLYTNAQN
jgi:hypothetical protein